jgi:hypothetical protein
MNTQDKQQKASASQNRAFPKYVLALVLKSDPSIVGGARKLVEKEFELLGSGLSGGHLINKLREARAHAEALAAALRDIEIRAAYSLNRPDKTNNDIQLEYVRQKAQSALAAWEKNNQ